MQQIDDWKVPHGYEVWATGVYQADLDKIALIKAQHDRDVADGKDVSEWTDPDPTKYPDGWRKPALKRVTVAPLWLCGLGVATDDVTREFVGLRRAEPGTIWIPRGDLAQRESIVALASLGLPIDAGSVLAVSRFLVASLEANRARRAETLVSSRTGWVEVHGEAAGWCVGQRWIGVSATGKKVVRASGHESRLTRALSERGSAESWRQMFTRVRSWSVPARWFVFANFAPPLMRALQRRSFVIHHFAQASSGKTALLRFAMAIWGEPQSLTLSFNATKLAIVEALRRYSDLPLAINELQAAAFKDEMRESIYQVVDESPRVRSRQRGDLDDSGISWRTILRTNGEQPLTDPHFDLGGVKNRMLEIHHEALTSAQAIQIHEWLEGPHASWGSVGLRYLRFALPFVLPGKLAETAGRLSDLERRIVVGAPGLSGDPRLKHLGIVALAQCFAAQALAWDGRSTLEWSEVADGAVRDAIEIAGHAGLGQTEPTLRDKIVEALELAASGPRAIDLSSSAALMRLQMAHDGAARFLSDFDVIVHPGVAGGLTGGAPASDWLWIRGHRAFREIFASAGITVSRAVAELKGRGIGTVLLATETASEVTCRRKIDGVRSRFYVVQRNRAGRI